MVKGADIFYLAFVSFKKIIVSFYLTSSSSLPAG